MCVMSVDDGHRQVDRYLDYNCIRLVLGCCEVAAKPALELCRCILDYWHTSKQVAIYVCVDAVTDAPGHCQNKRPCILPLCAGP
jgi:hypothetical protein